MGAKRRAGRGPAGDGSGMIGGIAHAPATDASSWQIESIFNSSDDAIICKTLDGVITSANKACERIFGYPPSEMIGRPISMLIPTDRLHEEEGIVNRLAAGERIDHYETVRRTKDGRSIQVSVTISPIRDASGDIVAACKIARDITEREETRARVEQMQAQLLHMSRLNDMGQLASAFAHELNQPLSAISLYISGAKRLMRSGDLTKAELGCDLAVAQVERAGRVIQRLRNFVKKSDARRTIESIPELVEEACALAMIGSQSAGVTLQHSFAAEALKAAVDKVQIQQVIVNLVRNAGEAIVSAEARVITVSVEPAADEKIRISVADTGPGIAASVRERLFEPFTTTKETGMGVGLSLCRTIVEAHDGDIWADESPEGGAMFCFTLVRV
jgi:two-component system sensor kinase FixL